MGLWAVYWSSQYFVDEILLQLQRIFKKLMGLRYIYSDVAIPGTFGGRKLIS